MGSEGLAFVREEQRLGPIALVVTLLVHFLSWRIRQEIRGIWLTVLGFCVFLAKVDLDIYEGPE